MYAKPGDWLIVEIAGADHAARRARILEVSSPDGVPPYRVRWLDTGREGLVVPGDDAQVMTQEQLDGRVATFQRHVPQRRGTS